MLYKIVLVLCMNFGNNARSESD